MARIKTPAIQQSLEVDLSILENIVNSFTAEARNIDGNEMFSATGKAQLIKERRAASAGTFRVNVAEMLRRRKAQLEDLEKDFERASAKAYKGIDANRVAIFERLVAGELAGADGDEGVVIGDGLVPHVLDPP